MTNGATPTAPAAPQQLQLPPAVYATFIGVIDQSGIHRLFTGLAVATTNKVQHVHLLFQSTGGTVADGVCLYNFLCNLPIKLSLYNVGTVASIAATAYLGAKIRKTAKSATFMLHKTIISPQAATAQRLLAVTKNVILDDERTEAILREHLNLPDELWEIHESADLWMTAEEAVKYGLATEIGEFAPPFGSQIFNL
jgi:ATP-dependent Clp protease protease subunit